MDKLTSELRRLYLFPGQQAPRIQLTNNDGETRTLVIDFPKAAGDEHWLRLCDVANALQSELHLPAPAVSVSGGESYRLWLSLAKPIPASQARQFLALLHQTYFGDQAIDLGRDSIELPPCENRATGLWSAFVNPSMGGALAEDLGLEMSPPAAAQAAFLEKLDSISEEAYLQALTTLQHKHDTAASDEAHTDSATSRDATGDGRTAPASATTPAPAPLLLKDATLEDIVRHLHAKGIEPTFRHVLKN